MGSCRLEYQVLRKIEVQKCSVYDHVWSTQYIWICEKLSKVSLYRSCLPNSVILSKYSKHLTLKWAFNNIWQPLTLHLFIYSFIEPSNLLPCFVFFTDYFSGLSAKPKVSRWASIRDFWSWLSPHLLCLSLLILQSCLSLLMILEDTISKITRRIISRPSEW